MRIIFRLLMLLLFSALSAAAWVAHLPVEWETPPPPPPQNSPIPILDQIGQAIIKRSAPFEISEHRLNAYLADHLLPTMRHSALSGVFEPSPPSIALQPGTAELRLQWKLLGQHPLQATVRLQISQKTDHHHIEILDGSYGRLRVPRGLLHPLKPILKNIAITLSPEIESLTQIPGIQIQQNKLVLDPRFPKPLVQAP